MIVTCQKPPASRPFSLLVPCLVFLLQAGWAVTPAVASDMQELQGYWEGEGPSGKISITISGDLLHFFARPDFWYETTFVLPPGTYPKQLQATIKDCAPPKNDIGAVVFAIFEIEGDALTLAVDDGSPEPPGAFFDASSRYHLRRAESPEKIEEAPNAGAR